MFKVLDEVCEPKRATKYSACVDLFAREDIHIEAGETKIVPLGVKINSDFFIYEIGKINVDAGGIVTSPDNASEIIDLFLKSHYLALFVRSSLALKGLIIPNGQGVIDLDYPDEIGLVLHNPVQVREFVKNGCNFTVPTDSDDCEFKISKGDKVAQCTLMEHKSYILGYYKEHGKMGYESDVVRNGGFGSSGK